MDQPPPEFTVVNKCDPPAFVVKNTIVIEAEIPRRPVAFTFTPDGIQSNCPGGVCPTPQAQQPRRRIFGR